MHAFGRALTLGLIVIATVACAPSTLDSTWTDPNLEPRVYRDILVFGIAPNPKVRRAYEDHFVEALRATGVQARASHTLLSDRQLSRASLVQEAVGRSGSEAVIVTFLAGESEAAAEASPGTAARTHVIPSVHGRLYPYYGQVYRDIMAPDYYASVRTLRLETNLYDAGRTTLVWSGRSGPLDPSSEQTMISEVIVALIEGMRVDGFLPAPTP